MKNETIVDRVVERLKAQPLGDLITEEDLHEIVKSAIPKVFFEDRVTTTGRDSWNQREERKPPLILEVMRDLLITAAREAVKDWLDANPDRVAGFWKQVMDDGLVQYVEQYQREAVNTHIRDVLMRSFEGINNERRNQGLQPFMFV